MASSITPRSCLRCHSRGGRVTCVGCQKPVVMLHVTEPRQELSQRMEQLSFEHDHLKQNLEDTGIDQQHPLLDRVNQWKLESIKRIEEVANDVRCHLTKELDRMKLNFQGQLREITTALRESQESKLYTETDINRWTNQLHELRQQLETPATIKLTHDDDERKRSSTEIAIIQFQVKPQLEDSTRINLRTRWLTVGHTAAGRQGLGEALDQVHYPYGLDIDDDGTLFIADTNNHRIMRWKPNATQGEIIAGGRGPGNRPDQLNKPTAVLIDRINRSLIISEVGNRRVMRWPLETQNRSVAHGEEMISNVYSFGLAMDDEGSLYVSNFELDEVRRYGQQDRSEGNIVAGGNGRGAALNQLNKPRNIYVDADRTVHVSDSSNNRVMKWTKSAQEGVVVAGGQGAGTNLRQLDYPGGIAVDHMGSIYVVDQMNHRVMRWLKDAQGGEVVVGGNGKGLNSNQLNSPASMLLDIRGNLYVVDRDNHRIQRFHINKSRV